MLRRILLSALLVAALSSCGKFAKVMKSTDVNLKYQAATDYFNDKDYYRASQLIDDITSAFMGTDKAEELQYMYAVSQYELGQYEMASHYYKTFHETYNRSPKAEEALYMSAYALYQDAPDYNLDQTNTIKAINEMQNFVNTYPASSYVPKAEKAMAELRGRLERKALEMARHYLKLQRYKAATISYTNFLKDFPDSPQKPKALAEKIEAEYELAEVSVFSKQRERYAQVLETYDKYAERFPESPYLAASKRFRDQAVLQIERIDTGKLKRERKEIEISE